MQKEKWKKVKSHKDYLISSWGRVYSLKSNCFMKSYIHKSRGGNYLRVCLNDNKKYMVHVLVGMHFKYKQYLDMLFLNPNANIQANHKDRNTLNPNVNNIEWTTEEENKKHLSATNKFLYYGKEYK